ncbi:MAG: DUF2190 family protein [Planctomycetota bacterium]
MSFGLPLERYKSNDRAEYTAGGAAVSAGMPVEVFSGLVGVAINDIPANGTDEVDITGRFRAKSKAAQAWAVGQVVGWDASEGEFTSEGDDQDFVVGKAVAAKPADAAYGVILLNA